MESSGESVPFDIGFKGPTTPLAFYTFISLDVNMLTLLNVVPQSDCLEEFVYSSGQSYLMTTFLNFVACKFDQSREIIMVT